MKTRHLISSMVVLMAILLASCSNKEMVAGVNADGTRTLTFNASTDAQAQTRAGAPSVAGYKLNYVLQVLDASGNAVAEAAQNNLTGTFTVSLPVGAAYTCLFWADFIPDAGSTAADNEYFTTTDLKAVTLKKALTGDDQCQAFCGTASIAADQVAGTTTVILKRAVAQVNLRSTAEMKGYSKVEAGYTNVPNTFNVLDNTTSVNGSIGIAPDFTVTDLSVATGANHYTFQSAYLLAPGAEVANMVQIELKTYNSAKPSTPIQTMTIANVPTKRNYKTNVKGTFKSANVDHTYTIDFSEWETEELVPEIPKSTWDGMAAAKDPTTTFSGGTGTLEDPYIIGKAADLAQLAANVNGGLMNGGTNYSGKYFKQTIDIDLNNHEWTPVGTKDKEFGGTFDGNGHKITNLSINSSADDVGLFGYISARIRNLHVSGNVKSTSTKTGANFSDMAATGGIVGYLAGTSGMFLVNCSFEGSVTADNGQVGGLVGLTQTASISDCKNSGAVSGGQRAGGIAGSINESSYIYHSYNTGTITGKEDAGGIIGLEYQGGVNFCYNIGDVSSQVPSKAGAIYGEGNISGENYCKTKYAVTNANEKVFGPSSWPAWTAGSNADGTEQNGHWKSIGGWNSGSPVYPTLWWEE